VAARIQKLLARVKGSTSRFRGSWGENGERDCICQDIS
jgi:hypothetical protein